MKKIIFKYKRQTGFTLIELLVAIAIIGLLTTLSMVGVRAARSKARTAKAQHDISQIYSAISILANDSNIWPGQLPVGEANNGANNELCTDGCTNSLSDPEAGITATDGNYSNWSGPYMHSVPVDAWENEYFFDTDYSVDVDDSPCGCGGGGCTDAAVVGSYGPDGVGNNQYNCDDIIKIIAR